MAVTLHLIMLIGASLSLCCVLGGRHSRTGLAVVSALVMVGAMVDVTFRVSGLGPLPWTIGLIGWGIVCAGLLRPRAADPTADAAADAPHLVGSVPGAAMRLHHPLGLIVTAGQLMAHAAIGQAPGAGSHLHSGAILLVVAGAGGALFVGWTVVLLVTGARPKSERGNLAGMSAMTAAMGLMAFA